MASGRLPVAHTNARYETLFTNSRPQGHRTKIERTPRGKPSSQQLQRGIRLSVRPSVSLYLSLYPCLCRPLYLSVCLCVCLSLEPSDSFCLKLSLSLSISLSFCLCVYLSVCLRLQSPASSLLLPISSLQSLHKAKPSSHKAQFSSLASLFHEHHATHCLERCLGP